MTNDFLPLMLTFFYSIVLPLIVGYAIKKIFNIEKHKFDILIKINIALFYPVTIVLTYWNMKFTSQMLLLPLIGLILPLLAGVIGYLFSKNRYDCMKKRGSYITSAMLSNRKIIGGLSAYIIFGEIAYVYSDLIIFFGDIITYVVAHPLGHYFGNKDKPKSKLTLKSILFRITNLGILAIAVGLILNFSGLSRPPIFSAIVDKAIKITAWVALLPIGASIELEDIKKYYRDLPSMFLLKFVITPVVAYLLAITMLTDTVQIITVIMLAMTPVAVNSVVVAKMNNLDEQVTMNAFLMTSAFYVAVIFPLTILILPHIQI